MQAVRQQTVNNDRYQVIMGRYNQYLDALNDLSKEPVRVFDPLSQKSIDELQLIREVSKSLQMKKDEDLKKAEQAATQAAEEAKKAAEEKQAEAAAQVQEEKKDEPKPE